MGGERVRVIVLALTLLAIPSTVADDGPGSTRSDMDSGPGDCASAGTDTSDETYASATTSDPYSATASAGGAQAHAKASPEKCTKGDPREKSAKLAIYAVECVGFNECDKLEKEIVDLLP